VRILVANKFWYHRGGLERVMFDEIKWLEDAGHEVAHFSTQHPENESSPWSDYFAEYLELGEGGGLTRPQKLRAAARMFYNRDAARRFTRLLLDFRPDVVHVHGIHRQLSPSILVAARDRRVPVVQTLHDYHTFCSADVLLRGNGAVCDPALCSLRSPAAAVGNRCVRGSLAQSCLSAAETAWRNQVLRHASLVAGFISPSRFLRDRLLAAGLDGDRISVIPNAVPSAAPATGGPSFLFAGRLAREKGVEVLVEAAKLSGVDLVIAGEGPLAPWLREQLDEHITQVGRVSPAEVSDLLERSAAAVVPSTCFENAPLSVLEPMARGVPVLAADIGGIPELIRDGIDGLLVEPGSAVQLAATLRAVRDDPGRARAMGAAARERARREFAPEKHLHGLIATVSRATGAAA
jgi:glycosyltransferase involved in cell wall biosynthesis